MRVFTQFLQMEDLTFDNDEEKCEGEAQQPHAKTPTSHLRGCSKVGLRSSSLPSSDLGSVIVLQSSASTTISILRPPGFCLRRPLTRYRPRHARPTLQLWPDLCSSHLASHLFWPSLWPPSKQRGLYSQKFEEPLRPPILFRPLSFSARTFTLHCLDLCPLMSALNWPLLLY
jgi:hypothetical protein